MLTLPSADDAQPRRPATRLGKVHASCMNAETKLVFFLQHVQNTHATWTDRNPIAKWFRVRQMSEDGIALEWMNLQLSGNLTWSFLPEDVHFVKLHRNKLGGTLQSAELPSTVSYLWLNRNQFTGEVDLTTLPSALTKLCLNLNEFYGPVDLQHLPQGLLWLWLNQNHFSGTVSLRGLPETIKEIYLSDNDFEGTVDVSEVPDSATVIRLRGKNRLNVNGVHIGHRNSED
mmetsp:Transcript_33509/g.45863  ORF Transcript_33509/g.45863 Transcript_33509/m.45863 type:complete len:230 (+) Transcript_33509:69-758(+)